MDVSIQVDLADDLLVALTERTLETRPALQAVADAVRDREKRLFATRGFGQWDALDPVTAQLKGGGRVLVDTGGLLRSLTVAGAPGSVENYTPDSVTVGSDEVSALMHRRGARGMPKRDPLPPLSAAEISHLTDVVLDHLMGRT